jgi:hypothetical protein
MKISPNFVRQAKSWRRCRSFCKKMQFNFINILSTQNFVEIYSPFAKCCTPKKGFSYCFWEKAAWICWWNWSKIGHILYLQTVIWELSDNDFFDYYCKSFCPQQQVAKVRKIKLTLSMISNPFTFQGSEL